MAKNTVRLTSGLNVHRLVAATAVEMANELFELYAAENSTYKWLRAGEEVSLKDARTFFVKKLAPKLYEDARQCMSACLAEPDDKVSPYMKEQIYEALCLDNDLRAKRLVAASKATIPSHLH